MEVGGCPYNVVVPAAKPQLPADHQARCRNRFCTLRLFNRAQKIMVSVAEVEPHDRHMSQTFKQEFRGRINLFFHDHHGTSSVVRVCTCVMAGHSVSQCTVLRYSETVHYLQRSSKYSRGSRGTYRQHSERPPVPRHPDTPPLPKITQKNQDQSLPSRSILCLFQMTK